MPLQWLMKILQYSVLSNRVRDAFPDRGGIMLVAPAGQLKTSLLKQLEGQLGVMPYSDLNTTNLQELRGQIVSGKVHCIMLYDLQKIYERNPQVTANVIGNLRALMSEGFTTSTADQTTSQMIIRGARALVLMATTEEHYFRYAATWEQSGFARRVLFVVYSVDNPHAITEAAIDNAVIDIPSYYNKVLPANFTIEGSLQPNERAWFKKKIGQKMDDSVRFILLRRIYILAKYFWERDKASEPKPWELIDALIEAGKKGVEVQITASKPALKVVKGKEA